MKPTTKYREFFFVLDEYLNEANNQISENYSTYLMNI